MSALILCKDTKDGILLSVQARDILAEIETADYNVLVQV